MREKPLVGKVVSISDLIPPYDEQKDVRLPLIRRFRAHLLALEAEGFDYKVGDEIITLDTLPAEIKDRFVCREGDSFLLTIFPQGNVWDENILRAFDEQVTAVAPRTSGMPIFFLLLLDLIAERALWATAAAAIANFAIVAITFKSLKSALAGMVPIILGAIWMVGLMHVLGMKFDFTNVMAVPLVLGIGIDNAIHIIHRYLLEKNIPLALRTTGKAILLTALTMMIGFGSLGFSPHRGLAGMGYVLVIGVAACFLTAVFVLPLILAGKKERLARQRSIWR